MDTKQYTIINPDCGMQITDYDIVKIDGKKICVRRKKRIGVISLSSKIPFNNFIISDIYSEIGDFVDGIATYKKPLEFEAGLIDEEGHVICSGYRNIWGPYKGVYIFQTDRSSYGLIDESGNKITDETYLNLYEVDGFFITYDGNYRGLINEKGNVILEPKYGSIKVFDKCLKVTDGPISNQDYPFGLYDLKGKKLLSFKYRNIEQINSDYLLLTTDSYGFYIYNLKKKKKQKLSSFRHYYSLFNDKYIKKRIVKNYQYGLIDLNGKDVLEPIYNDIILLNNGLIKVKDGNKWYLLDKDLKPFNDDKYYEISDYKCGLAIAQDIETYKYLFVDEQGNKALKYSQDNQDIYPTYSNIDIINEELVMVLEDDYWKLLKRPLTNPTCLMKFNSIDSLDKDLYKIKTNDNFKLIYKDGTCLLDSINDIERATRVGNLVIVEFKDGLTQVIDIVGNIKIKPIKCSRIDILNDDQVIIDNYLYDLNNIDYLYQLSINYEGSIIVKSFDSISKCQNYQDYLLNKVEPEIIVLKENHKKEIENLEKSVKKKIKSLFQEGE